MINLQLSNKEWYFLHIQLENIIKKNPDNYIAKNIFEKLVDNLQSLSRKPMTSVTGMKA